MLLRVILVITVICRVQPTHAASFMDMQSLYNNLTMGRNKYLRPQVDYDKATDITISFSLLHLGDIDAVEGTVSIAGYFVVSWKDENLVWTPSDFNNTQLVSLPEDKIWKPPLINANTATEMKLFGQDDTYVQLHYNGTAIWAPGENLKFMSTIDTTYFPFDKQKCELRIIGWGFPENAITFSSIDTTVLTDMYTPSSEWDLIETTVDVNNIKTPVIKYTMIYKRRPVFLLITLILPVVFMALLNICVFFLPQDSGERIGFSVTLLLAVVVFLTIAQGLLPATATPRLSGICILLLINMILSGMIVVSVIVGAWFYYKTDAEAIPHWIQNMVRFNFTDCVYRHSNHVHDSKIEMAEQNKHVEKCEEKIPWQAVAAFWDKLCLTFYFLTFVISTLSFFIYVISGN